MSALVTCHQCSNFIEPAPQFEKNSMGACLIMERWLDKFPQRRPLPREYDMAYAAVGGKVWMPLIERQCARFSAVQ